MNKGLLIYNCSTVIHTIHLGINSTFFCCCIGLALCYTNTFFNVTCQKDSKCFYTCCCIGFQKQFLFLIYFFWFFFSFWKKGLSENVFFQLHLPTGFKMFLPLLLHWISKTIFVSYLLLLWLFFLFEKQVFLKTYLRYHFYYLSKGTEHPFKVTTDNFVQFQIMIYLNKLCIMRFLCRVTVCVLFTIVI